MIPCDFGCGKDAEVKVTVTDLNGTLLDKVVLCKTCFNKYQQLDLQIGK